jgi:hypothetical protein
MLEHLQRLQALRGLNQQSGFDQQVGNNAAFFQEVARVKRWQHIRLAETYTDLFADKRYQPATQFFLDELYGANALAAPSIRDRDLIRMYPTMKRVLPKFAFDTVTKALALDVLSEEFDQALARELAGQTITATQYAVAFRAVGRKKDRLAQVELMQDVGKGLDSVVKKPMLYTTLKLLRGPSKLAGLAEMQRFLEAGFGAFRHMKGASYFLSTIATRETALIDAIFAGQPIDYRHQA